MNPHFFKRSGTDEFIMPDVRFKVLRYSKAAIGGPRKATIEARGDDVELWELLELLRCPVHILNDPGEVVWWGYVSSVELTSINPQSARPGRVKVGVDIDSMYNRVAIAYTQVDLTTGDQTRATTGWADDTESQAEYGVRELLDSRSAATSTHAEAARDKTLADRKYPITVVTPSPDARESKAVLTFSGWWSTLGWQYYGNAGTASVDTATQIYTIIDTEGQFINTVYKDVTSNIPIRETRDGDASALYEAVELLELGTDNFRRMLAEVDKQRNVRIYEEPAPSSSNVWQLHADGEVRSPYGEVVRRDTCPVAFWAVQADLVPTSLETAYFSDPNMKFIEEMEYDVEQDQLKPTAKDAPDPWDFPIVKPG